MRLFRRKERDVPTLEVGSRVRVHDVTWVVVRISVDSSGYARIDLESHGVHYAKRFFVADGSDV